MIKPQSRLLALDALRGLAIVTMVGANFAGEHLIEPHPFWLRLFGTFAAPIFIILSGMMVAIGVKDKAHGFAYFLKRGLFILAVAACVDLFIWQSYPFTCVDVLYLISFSLPISYVFLRLPNTLRWALIAGILVVAPLLQHHLGFCAVPTLISLHEHPHYLTHFSAIWRHWVIDGWFPLIPWLAFSWIGVQLEPLRHHFDTAKKQGLAISVGLLISGSLYWIFSPGLLLIRDGYSELFYPLVPSFFILAVGVFLTLFWLLQNLNLGKLSQSLAVYGKAPLAMYVCHLAAIEYLMPFQKKLDFTAYILGYLGLLIVLWGLAYGLSRKKK